MGNILISKKVFKSFNLIDHFLIRKQLEKISYKIVDTISQLFDKTDLPNYIL
jgi:hypothetical protein